MSLSKIRNNNKIVGSNALYSRWSREGWLQAQQQLAHKELAFFQLPAHLWLDHERCVGLTELRQALEEGGFRLSSFHPGKYQYSLYSPEETLQGKASVSYYHRCIDAAKALKCSSVCLRPTGGLADESREQDKEALVHKLQSLCSYAGEKHIKLCLQTVTPEEGRSLHTLHELEEIIGQVEGLHATLDTLAMSNAGESIPLWYQRLGEKIEMVIFQDGRGTDNRIWGEGVYPSEKYAAQLIHSGYKGPLITIGYTNRYQANPADADKKNLLRVREMMYKAERGEN